MTQADVISITGYSQSAVSAWMVSGKLESVNAYGVPIMSKEWLIDFMCVEGMKIRRKSDKHTEIMESFLRDNL